MCYNPLEKELRKMSIAVVMEAIEKEINKKSPFEQSQIDRISYLKDIKAQNDPEVLRKEREILIAKYQKIGILDQDGNISENYKN